MELEVVANETGVSAGATAEVSTEPFFPSHLSPSSASLYQECPRKWKFRYLDRLPDPPGEPALAGTFAHRVLELLLQLPAPERTIDAARKLARQAWPEIEHDADFQALTLDDTASKAFRWRGWQAIEGLWKLEDPCEVEVHATEHDISVEIDGVPFRGIIDRVDNCDDGLVIVDYKSGRAPSKRFVGERLTQVLLYAAAMAELTGQRPIRAQLVYLGQQVVETDVTDETLGPAVERLVGTWDSLLASLDTETFDASTGPLCAWCPFLAGCAEGLAEVGARHSAGNVRLDAPGLEILAAAG
jgi:putative RecB family exonuclease